MYCLLAEGLGLVKGRFLRLWGGSVTVTHADLKGSSLAILRYGSWAGARRTFVLLAGCLSAPHRLGIGDLGKRTNLGDLDACLGQTKVVVPGFWGDL